MNKILLRNQQGFSLIEALIAMVILSVGLLAVGLMQIGAMKGNTNALSRSNGVAVAQSVMSTLRTLPLDDALLDDGGDVNDLDAGSDVGAGFNASAADHNNGVVTGANGQSFNVFWNVADNDDTNTKTVRLFVYWTDSKYGLNRVIVTSALGGLYL